MHQWKCDASYLSGAKNLIKFRLQELMMMMDSGGGGKMCSAVNFTFKIMFYSEYVDFMMSKFHGHIRI